MENFQLPKKDELNKYPDTVSMDREATDQFIESYMGLVASIARPLARSAVKIRGDILHDLMQIGVIGLMDAMKRYDPKKKVQFSTFATLRIRGAMIDFLRVDEIFPGYSTRKMATIARDRKENEERKAKGLTGLSDEELARKVLLSPERYNAYISASSYPGDENGLDEFESNETRPEKVLYEKEIKAVVQRAVINFFKSVSDIRRPKLKNIFEEYYIKDRKLKDIGKDLGIGESRVSQLVLEIDKGIKAHIDPSVLKDGVNWENIGFKREANHKDN